MTTAELLATLALECPNGVSFDPMAVRLLRQKVPFEDWQIRNLQAEMFQLENGLWYSTRMVCNDDTRMKLIGQALVWGFEHGYFSIEWLFNNFSNVLSHLDTLGDFTVFIRHLKLPVTKGIKGDLFCLRSSTGLEDCLKATSKTISKQLEEAGGILAFSEIEQVSPHLTAKALENIRGQFLPEIHSVEVGGVPCWCSMEVMPLPEDFPERLTTVIDTLVSLDKKVSSANLEFALDLFYCSRFREEYALQDAASFMRVCEKHYHGEYNVFPNGHSSRGRVNGSSITGRRSRNPNTTFRNLSIPVGAKLVFTKDHQISCIVLDDFNQVEYAGKAWAISALAIYLLGVSSVNGFCHFSYEGEVLWDRRTRLERSAKHDESKALEISSLAKVQQAEGKIIGLEGNMLSSSTWRSFRNAGTSPRVADWARRLADGSSVEEIARENGLTVSTVKLCVANRRRYFDVCAKNGIVPEGMDV